MSAGALIRAVRGHVYLRCGRSADGSSDHMQSAVEALEPAYRLSAGDALAIACGLREAVGDLAIATSPADDPLTAALAKTLRIGFVDAVDALIDELAREAKCRHGILASVCATCSPDTGFVTAPEPQAFPWA